MTLFNGLLFDAKGRIQHCAQLGKPARRPSKGSVASFLPLVEVVFSFQLHDLVSRELTSYS